MFSTLFFLSALAALSYQNTLSTDKTLTEKELMIKPVISEAAKSMKIMADSTKRHYHWPYPPYYPLYPLYPYWHHKKHRKYEKY